MFGTEPCDKHSTSITSRLGKLMKVFRGRIIILTSRYQDLGVKGTPSAWDTVNCAIPLYRIFQSKYRNAAARRRITATEV